MITFAQLTRLGLFDAKVPRYTSYPPAPHFSASADGAIAQDWLTKIAPGAEISLYLHVPFCRRLCWFCACRTQGTRSDDPVLAYVETLQREIELLADKLPAGVTLSRLHWGGGTPTLLPPAQIRALAASLFQLAPLARGGEFSVEIDPNEADAARLDALAEAGMNRASIGVQDFDPLIQKAIGREQSYELTQTVAAAIRARGVRSLNADILYGLPHQNPARIRASVEKLLSLDPDRVALYGYAHVPWMSRRQQLIPSDNLPTPQERLELFDSARQLFVAAGYAEIGIDHFARPEDGLAQAAASGRLRRNFQGYTDDQAEVLLGLGASSISRFPQGYAQNAPATADYTKAVRAERLPVQKLHGFAGEDRLRARIIESLMCDFAVSRQALVQQIGADPARIDALFAEVAARFEDVITLQDGHFSIPPAARPLTRIIARAFDAYAAPEGRHSIAI